MVRTEISLFLKNVPGELGKLATMLAEAGIKKTSFYCLLLLLWTTENIP